MLISRETRAILSSGPLREVVDAPVVTTPELAARLDPRKEGCRARSSSSGRSIDAAEVLRFILLSRFIMRIELRAFLVRRKSSRETFKTLRRCPLRKFTTPELPPLRAEAMKIGFSSSG